jgi:anti-sigma regulatory factor (Ser/Thr protein kinase)
VVLDLDELEFIDMSGLRVVPAARRRRIPRRLGVHHHARIGTGAQAYRAGRAGWTTTTRRKLEMNAVTTDLPRLPSSVGAARRLVLAHSSRLDAKQRDDAALMVSELVTNALRHGVGVISLQIDIQPAGLWIEVSDEGEARLSPGPSPGAHGGWGLRIVEELADEWGVRAGSTKVWFRLHQQSRERRAHR